MLKLSQHVKQVQRELNGASDRSAAIVGGAFLEALLEEVLKEYFVADTASDKKIFEGNGPLATFSAKIDICFRVGLISKKEFQSLHTVRSIRNRFAHDLEDGLFSDQSIKDQCANLRVPLEMIVPDLIPLSQNGEQPPLPALKKAADDDPRGLFQEAVLHLMDVLYARLADANSTRRESPKDFSSAYEPAVRILRRLEELFERWGMLSKRAQAVGVLDADNEQEIKKYALLIRIQKFCIQQIQAAHAHR